jgi:thymidylate synthase ThyX
MARRKPLSESPNLDGSLTPDALKFLKPNTPVEPDISDRSELDQKVEPKPKSEKRSVMSKLMEVPEKEATVRLTVDLAESMHRKLSILSAKSGRKKAEIIRMLLDDALEGIDN